MDFKLDKQHEMARQLFKDFAENEVKPLAQETDETEVFPRETVDKMMKLGFMGIAIPKEYGGQGCDPLMYTMCVEELAKVCGTTSVIVSAHSYIRYVCRRVIKGLRNYRCYRFCTYLPLH